MASSEKVAIFGIKIDNISMDETIEKVEEFIAKDKGRLFCTPNVDGVIIAKKDREFNKIINSAGLVTCDSIYIYWASKFLGTPLKDRVAGSDFLPKFSKVAAEKGYSLFFLGGEEGITEIAAQKLRKSYPKLNIVGILTPDHKSLKNDKENIKIVKEINKTKPDILFVGFGTPKQEKWLNKNLHALNTKVAVCVGGTFNVISGQRKRAPIWVQRIGLEWFWRMMQEPRRLWRRYLINDSKFIWIVLKEKVKYYQRLF